MTGESFERTPFGNFERMYGGVDYTDKLVLDIGADYGTTARFFLTKGARHVHALEANPEFVVRLKEFAATEPRVTVERALASTEHAAELIHRVRPDIAKIDCEGCESMLLDVPLGLLCAVPTWLIETHSKALHKALWRRFEEAGFVVSLVEEWDFNDQVKVIRCDAMLPEPSRFVSLEEYERLVATGEPFAQANYGDGEWGCLLGHDGANVNGEAYDPMLGGALRRTLLQPRGHWCGTNPGRKLAFEVNAWVKANQVNVPWVWKETLASANVNGGLVPFLAALRARSVVLVGPGHLRELPERVLRPRWHCVIPDGTAWKRAAEIGAALQAEVLADEIVLFSAGMASNLLISHLWPKFVRRGISLLDTGAIWDPYVGMISRSGYRKPGWPEAMERNLA